MNARIYADQIITRSRDMLLLQEHQERAVIREALREISVSVASTIAERFVKLVDQQQSWHQKHGGFMMRQLKTTWRATIKNVKAAYPDHPACERMLDAIMWAHYGHHRHGWETILKSELSSEHKYYLLNSNPADRLHRVHKVLNKSF